MKALLLRSSSSDEGTFGHLLFGEERVCSGELPWRENRPNISCIPAGKYAVLWTWSPAFQRKMYLVSAVSGRSGIRIHSANYMGDREKGLRSHLYGCVALGMEEGRIEGQRAILRSRIAVRKLESWGNRGNFELEIKNV